jgi:hypothetical protein
MQVAIPSSVLLCVLCVSVVRPEPGTRAPAEKIGEHRYRIGQVVVDTKAGVVRAPARVNMRRGIIEYLAVAGAGKLHESVLLVEAEPVHLHVGLLLLGLEPASREGRGRRAEGGGQSGSGTRLSSSPLSGERDGARAEHRGGSASAGTGVQAWVEWRQGGRVRLARLEELAWDIPAKRPMPPVAWVFTGASPPGDGPFRAEQRSVVATYTDADSVLNNPLPTAGDDTVYKANERLIPVVGTRMTLVLRPAVDKDQHGAGESRIGRGADSGGGRSPGEARRGTTERTPEP